MKNVKFNTLMKQVKEGTVEIESWPILQMAYGVAWIRKASGIRESVRINDVPAEFAKQHNAK
jgi:hypothetical protein